MAETTSTDADRHRGDNGSSDDGGGSIPVPDDGRRSPRSPWSAGFVVALAIVFVVGGAIGLLGGLLIGGDDDDTAVDPAAVSCLDATQLVEASVDEINVINESTVQDAGFFAALIVEQRKVTFAMNAAPTCFSLGDRAGAEGLLAGLQGLLAATAPGNGATE